MSGRRRWKIKSAFTGFGDGPPQIRCTGRAALDGPQVPGNHDALPGAGHRCSRRVGPGDYSVRREGRPGAAKVCRERNSFSSEGRTIACPRQRAGTRRRAKTRYLSIRSLCASAGCWMRWPEWPKRVAPETIDRGTGNHTDYDRAAGGHRRRA
jgi:hypothetical protein